MKQIRPRILVVDDESSVRESFSLVLMDEYDVITAATGEAALKKISDVKIDLVYLDIRMPGLDGIETLKRIKKIDRGLDVVMVTAVNDVRRAGESIKFGAYNYIVKPFDVEILKAHTKQLIGRRRLATDIRIIRTQASAKTQMPFGLMGSSAKLKEVRGTIEAAAQSDIPVLIIGDPGTEKEQVARDIHDASPHCGHAFEVFTPSQSESQTVQSNQLFGIETGTSALILQYKKGFLELANQGTLLIHNIENLSISIQRELAQALEKREFKRVGSLTPIPLNLKLIATSANQEFDLPFNKTSIVLPSLRERRHDLPMIIQSLLEKYNSLYRKNIKISKSSETILSHYDWPGNMVELERLIEELVLLASEGEEIIEDKLPLAIPIATESNPGLTFDEQKAKFEKAYIKEILKKVKDNKSEAAQLLGLSQNILEAKI